MLTLAQAKAYGKKVGVRYYIKNERGCIIGGTSTLGAAGEMLERLKKEFPDMELHIEDVQMPL